MVYGAQFSESGSWWSWNTTAVVEPDGSNDRSSTGLKTCRSSAAGVAVGTHLPVVLADAAEGLANDEMVERYVAALKVVDRVDDGTGEEVAVVSFEKVLVVVEVSVLESRLASSEESGKWMPKTA
jgi:hypothetical protein